MKESHSKEYLNAFLDGELSASEAKEAMARLDADPEFKRDVCEYRVMKEMVHGAYAGLAEVPSSRWSSGSSWWRQSSAAILLLGLGVAGGWWARDLAPPDRVQRLAGLPAAYTPVALADRVDPDKIILHLDSELPERLEAVLDLAERMLAQRGDRARIEIVANSAGINLLRQGVTPYQDRIAALSQRHANLAFLACGQTLARLKREGVEVTLVPDAVVTSSAINEILSRMGQGWVYVKV